MLRNRTWTLAVKACALGVPATLHRMDLFLSLCLGIGLSAACGFRVFVPWLGLSIAAMAGQVHLGPDLAWLGTWPALITLATATVIEITAYWVPYLDHALDVAATPTAIIAGTMLTAVALGDVSPMLKWTLAVIAGGGAASVTQVGTVLTRAASLGTTAGLGNPLVAAGELLVACVLTVAALLLPVLALGLLIGLAVLAVVLARRTVVRR